MGLLHRDKVVVYVNGKRYEIAQDEGWPSRTLLSWLRAQGLTGTKLGCGEGGCGACTVLVSVLDRVENKVNHITVNACMMPVLAADMCQITTVEGIGSVDAGLHPVQDRMVRYHGSQCGFCTPGIVMAMYGIFAAHPETTVEEVEEHLDGNLCRCTGYRPIWDAAKSLCSNGATDIEDCAGVCASKGKGDLCSGTCLNVSSTADKCKNEAAFVGGPPPFPEELAQAKTLEPLKFTAANGKGSWWRPTSMDQLLEIMATYPDSRLVVGNTEVGIETKFKGAPLMNAVSTNAIPELYTSSINDREMRFGSCLSLSRIQTLCKGYTETSTVAFTIFNMLRWFASTQIRNVACLGGNLATASPISDMNPVLSATGAKLIVQSKENGKREVLVRDFFLSYRRVDLKPGEIIVEVIIPQCKPKFEYTRPFKQARRREDDISIVTSCMRVALEPVDGQWKISDCDIAYGGMAPTTITAKKTVATLIGNPWTKETIIAAQEELLKEMNLPDDVPGGQAQYRRTLAASFLLKFFYSVSKSLAQDIESSEETLPAPPSIPEEEQSGEQTFVTRPKPSIQGVQIYPDRTQPGVGCETELPGPSTANLPPPQGEKTSAAGVNKSHMSGPQHCTGEAIYIDDIPNPPGTLYSAFILSDRAGRNVKLGSIDATEALKMPGVAGVFTAKDIEALGGDNRIGAVWHDEEVFATRDLRQIAMVLGLVCAETQEQAVEAARAVKVHYEYVGGEEGNNGAITSIEEAIAADSFFEVEHEVLYGEDMDPLFERLEKNRPDDTIIVEGEVNVGGQEHFYLETNASLAIPKEGNTEMEVFSSTQGPTHTQQDCASASGLPYHKVVCKMKRMGGGFGGKETRSCFAAAAAAVAARRLNRPVKLVLDRDVDMQTSGQRHAFYFKYKAAARYNKATGEAMLHALDVRVFSNGGCSLDLSIPVLDRAMLHIDGCYFWPNLRAQGKICRTNQAPHTAFRGFGGPQGILAGETIVEHVASELRSKLGFAKDMSVTAAAEKFRALNFYKDGQSTHFGSEIKPGTFFVPRAWAELEEGAEVVARRQACKEFNAKNKWLKRGIAMLPTKFGINFTAKFMNQGGSLVHVYQDGTVLVTHGGTEMGQGLHTKVAQVAAHAFNIPLSAVHVGSSDTDKVANSNPTAASLSTDLYGMATLDACHQILERLAPIRAKLEAESGGKPVTLAQVAKTAFFSRVDLSAHGFYRIPDDACGYDWNLPPREYRGKPFNYFTQGVACSEVEVDLLTGDHRILRTDIIMDLGCSINPGLDIGQIEGAFVQGYGWCCNEELIYGDSQHKWVKPSARLFTAGPGTYKIPSFNDVPEVFNVRLLSNAENKVAVHSSKAVGEPPFFLGATVLFAIKDALYSARGDAKDSAGEQYFRMNAPCTSERIRMSCMDEIASKTIAGDSQTFQARGSW